MNGDSQGGREREGGRRRDIRAGPLRGGTALHIDWLPLWPRGIPDWPGPQRWNAALHPFARWFQGPGWLGGLQNRAHGLAEGSEIGVGQARAGC